MTTYQIRVEYLGTNFVGWQFQKNGLSIQEVLEKALSKYLKENIRIIGSGRTDSGVHAIAQVAHFDFDFKERSKFDLKNAINGNLPEEIRIINCEIVPSNFHARFSALSRSYNCLLYTSPSPRDKRQSRMPSSA